MPSWPMEESRNARLFHVWEGSNLLPELFVISAEMSGITNAVPRCTLNPCPHLFSRPLQRNASL